jgi:hypothetical protein
MAAFMTDAWAQEIRATFNEWPGAERKASKLQDFWDWIAMIQPSAGHRCCSTCSEPEIPALRTKCIDPRCHINLTRASAAAGMQMLRATPGPAHPAWLTALTSR